MTGNAGIYVVSGKYEWAYFMLQIDMTFKPLRVCDGGVWYAVADLGTGARGAPLRQTRRNFFNVDYARRYANTV